LHGTNAAQISAKGQGIHSCIAASIQHPPDIWMLHFRHQNGDPSKEPPDSGRRDKEKSYERRSKASSLRSTGRLLARGLAGRKSRRSLGCALLRSMVRHRFTAIRPRPVAAPWRATLRRGRRRRGRDKARPSRVCHPVSRPISMPSTGGRGGNPTCRFQTRMGVDQKSGSSRLFSHCVSRAITRSPRGTRKQKRFCTFLLLTVCIP